MVIESEIQGIGYSRKRNYQIVSLFGYSSRGLPGIEIVGPSKFSRMAKEKIVYLLKKEGIKIPNKRHVMCIDLPDQFNGDKEYDFLQWLELPLMILLCHLIENLPFHSLSGCVTMGKISIEGLITVGIPPEFELEKMAHINLALERSPTKFLNYKLTPVIESLYNIPLTEIFKEMRSLKYIEVVPDKNSEKLNGEHFCQINDLLIKT